MRKIKSYSRVIGKSLSLSCRKLLDELLPEYKVSLDEIKELKNLNIEIGFGGGEHIYHLAVTNPEDNFLGIEVYLQGVCNLLKMCVAKKQQNLWIYPNDADLLLEQIPEDSVKAFYILFPDPWPKHKHNKRRLVNLSRVNLMTSKLMPEGIIKFVTDVEGYYHQVSDIFQKNPLLQFSSEEEDFKFLTKYHRKALEQGNKIFHVTAKKRVMQI